MKTLLTGGHIFDGTETAVRRADVCFEGSRIVGVGENLEGDEAIDVSGKTILPGLIDCHVHVALQHSDFDETSFLYRPFSYRFFVASSNLRRTLGLGITTVRDAGFADLGMKQAVEDGLIEGPRLKIAVTMLGMTGGFADAATPSGAASALHGVTYPGMPDPVCDGIEGVRRKVRQVVRDGADFIKIASSGAVLSPSSDPSQPNFSQEEVEAIVETAADLGRPVMSHAHGAEGIKRAVRAGVRSIEHGTYLDQEAADMMAERGTWLVPTLSAIETAGELAKDPSIPEPMRRKAAEVSEQGPKAFALAARAGVKIAMGTDCPVSPHGTNLRELLLMSQNGLTPEQAFVAATSSAAELLGLQDELGSIEPGKRADFVIVDGDSFEFEKLPERIARVYKDGLPCLDPVDQDENTPGSRVT